MKILIKSVLIVPTLVATFASAECLPNGVCYPDSNDLYASIYTNFNSPALYEPIYTNSNSPTYTSQDYDNFMIHEAPHQQVEFNAHVAPHVVPHIMPPTPAEVLEFNAHEAPHLHFQHLK